MCYMLYLSTTSTEDLSAQSTAHMTLKRAEPPEPAAAALRFPERWYIGSANEGCSCPFRHVTDPQLGFDVPQDWLPEEAVNLEATAEFVALVRTLLAGGNSVDCTDTWWDCEDPLPDLDVDLSALKDEAFRFFENYHFTFVLPPANSGA